MGAIGESSTKAMRSPHRAATASMNAGSSSRLWAVMTHKMLQRRRFVAATWSMPVRVFSSSRAGPTRTSKVLGSKVCREMCTVVSPAATSSVRVRRRARVVALVWISMSA